MKFAILTSLAALLLGSTTFGQATGTASSATTSRDNPGVLGTSFADASASWEQIEHRSRPAYNVAIAGNMPLTSGVDGRLSYNYWWYNYGGEKSDYHLVTAEPRFYLPAGGVKPYAGVMLGYEWAKDNYNGYTTPPPTTSSTPTATSTPVTTNYQGTTTTTTNYTYAGGATSSYSTSRSRFDGAVWGLSAGVEVPIDGFAVTPHVGYFDTFRSHNNSKVSYGVEAHHWFSETLGGYADATYNDIEHSPNSWWYTVGIRYRY